jgi:hypothetical protein
MKPSWTQKLGFEGPSLETLHSASQKSESPEPITAEIEENSFETKEVIEFARTSLDFLAALCMPIIYKYAFPPVFLGIWKFLLSKVHLVRDFSQLAIGLPRGFGKTMLIKIFIIYCILFTNRKFILVCCGTQQKAINIITDVMTMLSELNIITVFGDWKMGVQTDRQELKRFGFRGRNIILLGFGVGGDVRGITVDNERPDVMLFDDIQTREDADSEVVSNKLEEWMVGTAMKAKSPHGCLFIFIANMYPTKHSLLRKLKSNPNWTKFIAGGILMDSKGEATSLWEDLQPLVQLLKEFQNDLAMGKPETFFAEVLNDEHASVNNLLDLTRIPIHPYGPDELRTGSFIIIDPANDKANSDAVSIGFFEVINGEPVLTEISEGRFSPGATIDEALSICFRHNCKAIAIESTSYQYSLLYWFNYICEQRGILGIECLEVYSGSLSKQTRILTAFKSYLAGEIRVHPDCRPAVHQQITQFNPLRRDNTDGLLDLLTYAPKVLELYPYVALQDDYILTQEEDSIPLREDYECSPF